MAIFRKADKLLPGMVIRLPNGEDWSIDHFPRHDGGRLCISLYRGEAECQYRIFPDDMVELGDL
jgi:hypothetical protein